MEPSLLKSYLFEGESSEVNIIFKVLQMEKSLLIYIGSEEDQVFNEMSVGMPMPNGPALGTTILGEVTGCYSQNLATKLASKLKKQVFVSFNVPNDRMLMPEVEKRLAEEIKTHPDKF